MRENSVVPVPLLAPFSTIQECPGPTDRKDHGDEEQGTAHTSAK
jgi:hypothetical protein